MGGLILIIHPLTLGIQLAQCFNSEADSELNSRHENKKGNIKYRLHC